MFEKKKLPVNEPVFTDKTVERIHKAISYEILDQNTLIINVFKNVGDKVNRFIPIFRVFQRKDEYITYIYESGKWSNGSMERVCNIGYWSKPIIDEKSNDIATKFLKKWGYSSKVNSIVNIISLQSDLMEKRRKVRLKREAELIDEEMKKFKQPIGKGINKFLTKDIFKNENFLFYNKKSSIGYCTNCEREISIKEIKLKHNEVVKCSHCKKELVAKADGISHRYLCTEGTGVVFTHYNDELLIRYFDVIKDYGKDYRNPQVKIQEVVRTVITKNKLTNYEFRNFHLTGIRWCKCTPHYAGNGYYNSYFSHDIRYVSHDNYGYYGLKRIIPKTSCRYSEIDNFLKIYKSNAWDVENYLEEYKKHPVLETFMKLGFYNIALYYLNSGFTKHDYKNNCDVSKLNEEEKELHKILGLNKQQFKIMNSVDNPTMEFYECIKANKTPKVYSKEEYELVNTKCSTEFKCKKMFDLLEVVSYRKVMKYLNNNETDLYLDYIDFCKKLNWDLRNSFVAFPKDLKDSHDEAQALIKEEEKKEEIKAINKLLPDIAKKYNFEFKDLMIVAPKDAKEYIRESQVLHNCISKNYMSSMANANCCIVFIRKKSEPDKPYFAMEISSNKVGQVRGMNNCSPTEEVKECVEAFKLQLVA